MNSPHERLWEQAPARVPLDFTLTEAYRCLHADNGQDTRLGKILNIHELFLIISRYFSSGYH